MTPDKAGAVPAAPEPTGEYVYALGQWWLQELDGISGAQMLTADQYRAINIARQFAVQTLAAAPKAAPTVAPAEPTKHSADAPALAKRVRAGWGEMVRQDAAAMIDAQATEIDALRAEVARLRADAQSGPDLLLRLVCDLRWALGDNGKRTRPELVEYARELRADAERLDYIERNARQEPKMDGQHVWWPTNFNHGLKGPTLRAAIDAARTGAEG